MDWQGIHITDGTGQQDRALAALRPRYFDVDEHSFEDLMAMGAEFASVIKFYNLGNEADDNWGELFDADEAVVMASILSINLDRIESDFYNIPYSHSVELLSFMLDLAHKINHWYLRLSACGHESGQLLAAKLETIIKDKLAAQLHNLLKIEQFAGIPWVGPKKRKFAPVWELDSTDGADLLKHSTIDPNTDDRGIKSQLRDLFKISSNAISYLKSSADSCLQQSLLSKQHEPSIGLFIVFVQLFQKAQYQLNRFTLQHLDFYYRQILMAENKPPIPLSYYLLLESRAGSDWVQIEKNTEFSAGQDAELNDIVYRADETLRVSDARIEALATLYLQHDPLISPESDLGFVTRIKANRPALPNTDLATDATPDSAVCWPLFGAEPARGARGASSDARMGFSVASALLMLEEGTRKIDITIELESIAKIPLEKLIEDLLACNTVADFRQLFGSVFARYLLSFNGCLEQQHKDKIISHAESLPLPENMVREITELLKEDWQWLFYKGFKESFHIDLTTEDGWLAVQDYYLQPLAQREGASKTGFKISFVLGQEAVPVTAYKTEVHGGQLQTELPVMQCRINPLSNFCPYSVSRDLVIDALRIDVDVSDIKNLLVYNQHGQLDPSKPFQPFGPQPGSNAYFVFGNYELARKPLQEMKISLDWAELPRAVGGFEERYRGYHTTFSNHSFQAAFSALVDGRWMPEDAAQKPRFSLFETIAETNRVAAHKEVEINNLEYARPIEVGITETAYRYDLKSRKGFYRVSLVAPETAFGHVEHGPLLTEVLTANAKLKISKPKPLPNPPYTPMLNGISLAYKASTTIYPSRATAAPDELSSKIFHLHPFGVETVYPPALDAPCHLLPQYTHEGNLFIGLSGTKLSGPLSLLFHLSKDQAQAVNADHQAFDWFYLRSNRWVKFQKNQILSDSTHGFLAPGIVTLNIPMDITNDSSILPGDYYWLRVSVSHDASAFPSCYSVQPHAIKVSRKRQDSAQHAGYDHALEPNWTTTLALPGISSIKQAYAAFGGRDGESDTHLRVRVSERLRHKNRASMPWDYERLILEEFPEIGKVKCFNSISSTEDKYKPGHVLIVVVPDRQQSSNSCAHEMISAPKLDQIKDYVKKRCSPFAEIEVRNPQYEQVQVRCTVKLADTASEGIYLKRLNQEISDYICPWEPVGYKARFGWSIRQQDIESHIFGLDYVESVTNFSMLHITVDRDGNYSLFDTVKSERIKEAVIKPCYPWSLALPMENHFIETSPTTETIPAEITGVNELSVGSTFIIVGSSENGEKE
jgi:hypothetical protein